MTHIRLFLKKHEIFTSFHVFLWNNSTFFCEKNASKRNCAVVVSDKAISCNHIIVIIFPPQKMKSTFYNIECSSSKCEPLLKCLGMCVMWIELEIFSTFQWKCQIIDIQSIRVPLQLFAFEFCFSICYIVCTDAYQLNSVDIFMSVNRCHSNGSVHHHDSWLRL